MSDRINCRNCIHFNDLEHRCCLNDGNEIKKECYFTLSKRKPKGKDIVIENLKTKVSDLEAKLAEYEKFMKDNGFKSLEELDNYIQKIHSHYDEVKNNGTCGLCEKLDNELINQLKQQLAESEKAIKYLKGIKRYDIGEMLTENAKLKQQLAGLQQEKIEYTDTINFVETSEPDIVANELDRLNQQLAEKDKAIENLRIDLKDWQDLEEKLATKYDKVVEQLAEKEKMLERIMSGEYIPANIAKKSLKLSNQDKISFVVEQLEQIFLDFNKKVDDEFGDIDIKYITLDVEEINFYLKDKIKSIKEGK